MRLDIGVSIVIDGVYHVMADGGAIVGDETNDLVAKYKQKLEAKKLEDTAFVEKQRLLNTLGTKRWSELRELIKEKLDAFNAAIGYEAVSWDDLHADRVAMTRQDDDVKLEGGYDEAVRAIFFRCPQEKINVAMTQVVRGSDVVFVVTNTTTHNIVVNSAEEIARGLLRDFLGR